MVIAISVASLPLPVKKAVWMSPGAISASLRPSFSRAAVVWCGPI